MTNKQTRRDEGYYWDDENHSGIILVSQRMIDKHKLETDVLPIAQLFDDEEIEEEEREDFNNYSHYITISHCVGWSKTKTDKQTTDTPQGDVNSEAFVMWWNDLPLELLNEPKEDVNVYGWRDG